MTKKWRLGFRLELGHKNKEVEMSQETWTQEKKTKMKEDRKRARWGKGGANIELNTPFLGSI